MVTFIKGKAPYLRRKDSVNRIMIDVLIALAPVTIFAFVMAGLDALKIIGLSMVTMLLAEVIYVWIRYTPYRDIKYKCDKNIQNTINKRFLFHCGNFKEKTKIAFSNFRLHNIFSPLVSALIFALCMPHNAPWWSVIVSALFGIVIAKLLFGGLGQNIFNPAATARVFWGLCFGTLVTDYSNNFVDVVSGGTPLGQLVGSPLNYLNYSLLDLFTGMVPGALGEVSAVLILVGAIYLFARRAADIRTSLSMIITFYILMLFAGLALGANNVFHYATYHLLSGGLLFGAIFMVTDPVTTPATKVGRIMYGMLVAISTSLIRLYGAYPEGVAFSILICNVFVSALDSMKIFATNKYYWYHPLIFVGLIGIFVGVEFLAL